jgi:hypothetical protein
MGAGPRRASRPGRALGGAAALVVALSVVHVATPSPAAAQQDLIDADPAVVQARADLYAAQSAAHEAVARLEATTQQQEDLQEQITAHENQIADIERQRSELAAQRDTLEAYVRARARALYVSGGGGVALPDLLVSNAVRAIRRAHFGEIAERRDQATMRQLAQTRDHLAAVAGDLRREQADLAARKAALDALLGTLAAQKSAADQRVAEANAALERARVIGALHAAGDPVMGPNTLSATQILGWFNSRGYHPQLDPGVTMAALVDMFLQEGADEGVRGDFAFAQAIIETGGFAAAPANNFSGLGWCDSCTRGNRFPTPRDGVRAQIQLLLNYANPWSRTTGLHHPPSPYWWGADPTTAARNFDTYFAKGWAPTWRDMGHGNWATDPNYSGKVINVFHLMQSYGSGR